ncbi:MAG: hypothetical protein J7K72_04385, partial [Candidatus Aenigmarchaeota archaeon]|nr:hypothetical protein [Candidatus Aenigmarchaeota archaeon]
MECKKAIWPIVAFALILVFSQNTLAYTDFSVTLSQNTISGCPGYTIPVDVVITNNDDETHTYFLSLKMPDGWAVPDNAFIQPDITLASGETQTIRFFVNPPNVNPGIYKISVGVSNGYETIFTGLDVEVLKCHSVVFSGERSLDVCKDKKFLYTINITNDGKDTETFDIDVTSSWSGSMYSDVVKLLSGETKALRINITAPSQTGKFTISASATSQTSYAHAEFQTSLNVENCYDFSLSLQPHESTSCMGRSSKFSLVVTNIGTKKDSYNIYAPDWASASEKQFELEPGEEKSIDITASPEFKGKTDFNITVSSASYPKAKKLITGSVNAVECKDVAVIVSPARHEICGGLEAEYNIIVKNTGSVEDTFGLTASLGILEENKVVLMPGEIKTVKLTVDTDKLEKGKEYNLTVVASSGDVKDEDMVLLFVENCYSLQFEVTPEEASVCKDEIVDYTLVLKNTGKFNDEYIISIENKTIGNASLSPQQLKMFATRLKVDYPEGEYTLKFRAYSEHASIEKPIKLIVKPKRECYSVDVSTKEHEKVLQITAGKGEAFSVKIKNTGERTDTYKLEADGPEWIHLSVGTVSLQPDEEKYIYVYASPGFDVKPGIYEVSIKAVSENSEASVTQKVEVVSEFAQPNITTEINQTNATQGSITG